MYRVRKMVWYQLNVLRCKFKVSVAHKDNNLLEKTSTNLINLINHYYLRIAIIFWV